MAKLQEKKTAQGSEDKGLYTKSSRLVCSRGPERLQIALLLPCATMLAGKAERKLEHRLPFSSLAFFQLHYTI